MPRHWRHTPAVLPCYGCCRGHMDVGWLFPMLSVAWVYERLCVYSRIGNITKSWLPWLMDGHKDFKHLGKSKCDFCRHIFKVSYWINIIYVDEGGSMSAQIIQREENERWESVWERKKGDMGRGEGEEECAHVTAKNAQCGHPHSGSLYKIQINAAFSPKCSRAEILLCSEETHSTPLKMSLTGLMLYSKSTRLTRLAFLKASPVGNHPGCLSSSQETTILSLILWTWL